MVTKVIALLAAIVLLFAPNAAFAQINMALPDSYLMYAVHWNGSIATGTVVSIAIPDGAVSRRATYPIGVQLISTAPAAVSITINSVNHPTQTLVEPTPLNTNTPAEFKGYTSSNAGFGLVVTEEPASTAHSIMLDGVRFPSGGADFRNINLHVAATAGATGYITWKVAQK
jgi:hypothetical protein